MSKGTTQGGRNGYQFASLVRASAHEIWLAGLGAYSRAGKEGTRLFESLVELGESVERSARDQVARPFRVAERRVDDARSAVNETWQRIGMLFERRIMKTLHALQIPTQRDVAELTERVEELQATIRKLSRHQEAGGKPAGAVRKKKKAKAKTSTTRKATRAAPRKSRAGSKTRSTRRTARS